MKWLQKYADHAYALLRIVSGFMFAFHGVQKTFGVLSEFRPALGSQIWIGGIIELVGGLAIMLGFSTRLAAFICSGEMAVAYFQFHWKFQLGPAFYGYGYAVAVLIVVLWAMNWLERRLTALEYETFMLQ